MLDRLGGLLDAKRLPKGSPRGSQMELKRHVAQKIVSLVTTSIFIDFSMFFVDFLGLEASIWRPNAL